MKRREEMSAQVMCCWEGQRDDSENTSHRWQHFFLFLLSHTTKRNRCTITKLAFHFSTVSYRMTKVQPEFFLDVSQLPKTVIALPTDSSVQPTTPVPRQLPKELADFKVYLDSKCCYHSAPLEKAELVRTDAKVAYKYTMKTLMEVRSEHWKKRACHVESWDNTD